MIQQTAFCNARLHDISRHFVVVREGRAGRVGAPPFADQKCFQQAFSAVAENQYTKWCVFDF